MPVKVRVELPGDTREVVIRNMGPTTDFAGRDPEGWRVYEWRHGDASGEVEHRRGDGWAVLIGKVFNDVAQLLESRR